MMNEILKPSRPWIRDAMLYEKMDDRVKCELCERRCLIQPDKTGFCRTRFNVGGNLYTLVYGNLSSISANPIEKKPFYHFWPGSVALTCGSWSCNFECPWCQNWHISKSPPELKKANYISPENFVKQTIEWHCHGTSISFNEPSLMFEYSLDVFRLARTRGLYNTFVTNGYMTRKALYMLREAGLDAINIDIKGDTEVVRRYCGANVELVWRNVREAKKLGIHLEVVNLVIPGVNDREEQLRELAKRHYCEAGQDTPLHFTAYYPAYKFNALPTPVSTLERAHDIAVSEGLDFVYIGNVPGHKYENTYCPGCGELLIKRFGLELLESKLKEKKCPKCRREIPIVGKIIT
ncbi:MAG: AmmeMemoRadiSam system radical SAM enzyme [Candidatus Hadarchaeum sp.]|uniref:AmmeMemoRadiSam system radical SAM enzyme n=2 Tax=Candidatus Hadarchaeum sp. TaxID=2883567 RepID=UPI00316B02E0